MYGQRPFQSAQQLKYVGFHFQLGLWDEMAVNGGHNS